MHSLAVCITMLLLTAGTVNEDGSLSTFAQRLDAKTAAMAAAYNTLLANINKCSNKGKLYTPNPSPSIVVDADKCRNLPSQTVGPPTIVTPPAISCNSCGSTNTAWYSADICFLTNASYAFSTASAGCQIVKSGTSWMLYANSNHRKNAAHCQMSCATFP